MYIPYENWRFPNWLISHLSLAPPFINTMYVTTWPISKRGNKWEMLSYEAWTDGRTAVVFWRAYKNEWPISGRTCALGPIQIAREMPLPLHNWLSTGKLHQQPANSAKSTKFWKRGCSEGYFRFGWSLLVPVTWRQGSCSNFRWPFAILTVPRKLLPNKQYFHYIQTENNART